MASHNLSPVSSEKKMSGRKSGRFALFEIPPLLHISVACRGKEHLDLINKAQTILC